MLEYRHPSALCFVESKKLGSRGEEAATVCTGKLLTSVKLNTIATYNTVLNKGDSSFLNASALPLAASELPQEIAVGRTQIPSVFISLH